MHENVLWMLGRKLFQVGVLFDVYALVEECFIFIAFRNTADYHSEQLLAHTLLDMIPN